MEWFNEKGMDFRFVPFFYKAGLTKWVDCYRLLNKNRSIIIDLFALKIFRKKWSLKRMEMDLKLCDSDYKFMTIVWEAAPINSGELVKICNERLGWKKSTTYTVIKKLSERGFLRNENAVVSVLVKKEDCQAVESEYFVERTFHGSLPKFIAAFLNSKKLTEEEAEEIKKMIDEHTGE